MSIKFVQCKECKKSHWMDHKSWRRYRDKLKITHVRELNEVYVCKACRAAETKENIRTHKNTRDMLRGYVAPVQRLQQAIQEEVDILVERGLNDPVAKTNFRKNLDTILKKRHITKFEFDIQDNILVGLRLKELPFLGDIYIPIKGLGSLSRK